MSSVRLLGLILIGVISTTPALAKDDAYLCVAESSVGFSFDKTSRDWERTNFKAESKYVLSKSSDVGKEWEVKKIGESSGTPCEGDFNMHGFISCKGILDFKMNKISLRYIVFHPYGYVVKDYPKDGPFQEGSMTPYLEIGKCSPL